MTFLCKNFDGEISGNPLNYVEDEPDINKKTKRYTFNNINLDEVDKIIKNYIPI